MRVGVEDFQMQLVLLTIPFLTNSAGLLKQFSTHLKIQLLFFEMER